MATKTINQLWEETNDKVGLRETEPIYCPICTARALANGTLDKEKPTRMVMRRSRIHTVADVRMQNRDNQKELTRPYADDIAFKCPKCDLFVVFGVPLDMEYAQKVLEMRGGTVDFVLPDETWDNDETVNAKMKRWGYW